MEKRGVINDQTPANTCGTSCGCTGKEGSEPTTKEAADVLEDGVSTRAADIVAAELKKKPTE